jgi:hypothetical protein
MKKLILLLVTLLSSAALAQECPAGKTCVDDADMTTLLQLAKERQCLDTTKPNFDVGSVTIITDREGRIYYSGGDPESPYKVTMSWCHYEVTAEGKVKVLAAIQEPPTWGFRFRPKAYLGYLILSPLIESQSYSDGLDAGLMLDLFYYKLVNFNIQGGVRSAGLGIGLDITANFGGYVGYAVNWSRVLPGKGSPHDVLIALDFAF